MDSFLLNTGSFGVNMWPMVDTPFRETIKSAPIFCHCPPRECYTLILGLERMCALWEQRAQPIQEVFVVFFESYTTSKAPFKLLRLLFSQQRRNEIADQTSESHS